MRKLVTTFLLAALLGIAGQANAAASWQQDRLDRGVVAVKTDDGVFVSWRHLAADGDATFNIYRDGVKLNEAPLVNISNYTDAAGTAGAVYKVEVIGADGVIDSGVSESWSEPYMKVHLDRPATGFVGEPGAYQHSYTYSPDDVSIGDVDGDGVYELFVKWVPSDAKDSASSGYTGNTLIDCYKLDGTKLWRVDLGQNIRSGNHYTQFMVYDFDGDGSAEFICRTAPGTKDGLGNYVTLNGDDPKVDYRVTSARADQMGIKDAVVGHVLDGPDYFTVFSGKTGEALASIYNRMNYSNYSTSVWGDTYGNRSDRHLAAVAYLDGKHPSAIMCRGYYRGAFVWALDFDGKELKEVWFSENKTSGKGLWGEGAHGISVADVDGDGCDEIIYGAASLDHDGSLLYRTGGGHGDALHVTHMLPEREGLQVFMPHEEKSASYPFDTELRDARTGEILYMKPQSGNDIGRGIAANCSALYPGHEYWAASDAGVYNHGTQIANNRPSINFRIYWDGDLLDELYDGTWVTKPEPNFSKIYTLADFSQYSHAASCNGTKATPNLQADLFGDWREEVILHDGSTDEDLLIFTTTIPTQYNLPCLLEDRQYRLAIAWQNCAYNQPPHLSYSPEEVYSTEALVLVSSGSSSQMVCLGEEIEPVVMTCKRAETLEAVSLPEGLSFAFDKETMTGTLTGKIAEPGDYEAVITTKGAADGNEVVKTLAIKVYRPSITSLTTLAYYSFDGPGETLKNHVNGEATAVGNAPAAIEGVRKGAAEFDGTNHYAQTAYDAIQVGEDDFTIEFWMKSKDDAAYVIHKGSNKKNETTGATGKWIGLELKNDVLYFAIDDDVTKSQAYVKEAGKWFNDEWHHVVLVRDKAELKLRMYIDAVEVAVGEDATGDISDNMEDFVIGNVNVDFNNNFTGCLDELYIYKGAMSASKVAERFAATGDDLAYFPFDEVDIITPNLVFGEATAVNGVPTAADGVKGGAVEFKDGIWYSQPAYDAIQFGTSNFSFETWLKSTDDNAYVFFKGSHSANAEAGTTGNWIGLERKSGYLCFSIDDDKTKSDCKLASADHVFNGEWHHIVCTRDYEGKSTRLYVDGVLAASNTTVGTGAISDNDEPLVIGCSDEVSRPFEGLLDEFYIRPYAMSADEVKSAYEAGGNSAVKNVVASDVVTRCWLVDAFSGIVVAQGAGDCSAALAEGASKGIYLMVIEKGRKSEVYKFIRK